MSRRARGSGAPLQTTRHHRFRRRVARKQLVDFLRSVYAFEESTMEAHQALAIIRAAGPCRSSIHEKLLHPVQTGNRVVA